MSIQKEKKKKERVREREKATALHIWTRTGFLIMKASQHGADLASKRTQSPKPRTAGTLHMTQGCVFLDTKKVVTVENILPRTLKLSFSRLKIAVIHNTSVIDRHFLSPESSFCEKHHITSVHKQSFCENTDTGLELPRAQFPCHVQMARCVYTAEARVTEARPHLQVRLEASLGCCSDALAPRCSRGSF